MFCLQAKFMSLRSQLVERSLENHLQLYTIVLDYPILLYNLILCLFFLVLMCLCTTLYIVSRLRCNWCRPLGGPRTFWSGPNAGQVEIPENSWGPATCKIFLCYGEVRITSATSEFVFQTESLLWKKWIVGMTNVCTTYVVQQWKRLCYFRCTSGSQQLPTSELEEEEEREKLFKLIDTWNDLVHQWVFHRRSESFASKDINHNGKLSLAEIDKVPSKRNWFDGEKSTFVVGGGSSKSVTSLRSSLRFRKPERAENWSLVSGKLFVGVSKNRGTPKSSILIEFSTINHPFWGTTIFGKHPYNHESFRCHLHRPFRRSWVVLPSSTKLGPETWVVPAVIIMTWGSAMAPWLLQGSLE